MSIFTEIDFRECYQIKYFAVPNFRKFAKNSNFVSRKFLTLKYSARAWLEFAIPFLLPKTFNTRFSYSIPWSAPEAVKGIPDLFTKNLPFANKYQVAWFFYLSTYTCKINWCHARIVDHAKYEEIQAKCV